MLFPPQHQFVKKAHGRIEIRRLWASDQLNDYLDFPHVGQVFCVERRTETISTGKTSTETVYGLTSLSSNKADPARLQNLVQGQWSIENRLHWVRDVTFDEDRCRIRTKNGPQVMASIRNLVISILRLANAKLIAPALRECAYMGAKVLRLIGLTP